MGGRKGYPLSRIVGDVRKVIREQKELFESIDREDPKETVRASAKILAKSDREINALAYSLKFIHEIEKEGKPSEEETIKERRDKLSKKWIKFRKREGKKFDPSINRRVVDSVNDALGGKK